MHPLLKRHHLAIDANGNHEKYDNNNTANNDGDCKMNEFDNNGNGITCGMVLETKKRHTETFSVHVTDDSDEDVFMTTNSNQELMMRMGITSETIPAVYGGYDYFVVKDESVESPYEHDVITNINGFSGHQITSTPAPTTSSTTTTAPTTSSTTTTARGGDTAMTLTFRDRSDSSATTISSWSDGRPVHQDSLDDWCVNSFGNQTESGFTAMSSPTLSLCDPVSSPLPTVMCSSTACQKMSTPLPPSRTLRTQQAICKLSNSTTAHPHYFFFGEDFNNDRKVYVPRDTDIVGSETSRTATWVELEKQRKLNPGYFQPRPVDGSTECVEDIVMNSYQDVFVNANSECSSRGSVGSGSNNSCDVGNMNGNKSKNRRKRRRTRKNKNKRSSDRDVWNTGTILTSTINDNDAKSGGSVNDCNSSYISVDNTNNYSNNDIYNFSHNDIYIHTNNDNIYSNHHNHSSSYSNDINGNISIGTCDNYPGGDTDVNGNGTPNANHDDDGDDNSSSSSDVFCIDEIMNITRLDRRGHSTAPSPVGGTCLDLEFKHGGERRRPTAAAPDQPQGMAWPRKCGNNVTDTEEEGSRGGDVDGSGREASQHRFISLLRQHRKEIMRNGSVDELLRDFDCRVVQGEWGYGGDGDGVNGDGRVESSSGDSMSIGGLSMLCAERVSQMTKTYNDIEAVSRLLEEKEVDLELAARIGQTLLSKNKELTAKNEVLDEQLSLAHDKVNQLRHDLAIKEECLRVFHEGLEENELGDDTPSTEESEGGLVNVSLLQKKVDVLENENIALQLETADFKSRTTCYEEKEKRLVEDCIKQLAEVNCQVETFAAELQYKAEENGNQKEQIAKFLSQTDDLQVKIRKLTVDNMDLHDKLLTSTDSQRTLGKELGRMQDKYDELYEMLEEAQTELQVVREKQKLRGPDRNHQQNAYSVPPDSLASELETSLQQELAQSNRRAQSWKIFETARAAKRAVAKVTNSNSVSSNRSLSSPLSAVRSRLSACSGPPRDSDAGSIGYSAYLSDGESLASDGYSADMDSLYGSNQELGRPGIPGSNDLESALRRLVIRRENERDAEDDERRGTGRNRLQVPGAQTPSTPSTPRAYSTDGASTPSSVMSLYNQSPCHGAAATLKTSDKLKIMKPLEGSVTLRHWQHLATPHLGGIFEQREGVQMKGERTLDTEEEVMYRLSDFEEDEDVEVVQQRGSAQSTMVHSLIDAAVRSPVSRPSRDWSEFQDPRTPSPRLALYGHSSSPSPSAFGHHHPMQASTPVLNSASSATTSDDNSSVSSGGMSLGLAALLDSRDSPSLRGSVMRAAMPISKPTSSSPRKQDLNILSSLASTTLSSPSDSGKGSASSSILAPGTGSILFSTRSLVSCYKNLPGSRSSDSLKVTSASSSVLSHVSTSLQSATPSSSASSTMSASSPGTADKNSWVFSPGMTGQGFLHQLKNRGYSLYGLWANASAAASAKLTGGEPSTNTPATGSTLNVIDKDGFSVLSSTVDGEDIGSSGRSSSSRSSSGSGGSRSGFNLLSGNPAPTSLNLAADDLSPTTMATTTAITTMVNSESSPSGRGVGGGVFGSYSGFRRGGNL